MKHLYRCNHCERIYDRCDTTEMKDVDSKGEMRRKWLPICITCAKPVHELSQLSVDLLAGFGGSHAIG